MTAVEPSEFEPSAIELTPEVDVPRPPRFLRITLAVFEVACWAAAAVLAGLGLVGVIMMGFGEVPVTGRVIDGASLIENGGVIEGGSVDVYLEDVPLGVSWPFFATVLAVVGSWAILCVCLARISRGLRAGVPFRSVTPRFLYAFAAVWTVVAIAAPFVMGATQPAMAQAAGVALPGVTFAYTMTAEDLLGVFVGPVIAVVVAVLATGSRMWSEHRTLV
ncbi:hypothetical protein [Brevibacterium yomogidense]|uniref:hypothetical protein n=1 Tax=Brevibacterium yomogidense TaxID=946573 RepID=UPI0018DF7A95|nr:hypothetical protein [Brevibacterium yomogidense]